MVKLQLLSSRGNSNSRYFPHTGYLALTPVRVDGVVRTKLDDDGKPLLASSISVSLRCIESRIGRLGVAHSNVLVEYTQVVWSKPPNVEWAEIGDSEHHFKLTIPIDTPGFSSANLQDYRIFWRVEAVINHTPIFAVGSRLVKSSELALVRYDVPSLRRPSQSQSRVLQTKKPRAPVIRYFFSTPASPVGPLDIVTVPLTLHPVDPSVAVRGVSLIVERRVEFHETSALSSSSTRQAPETPLTSRDVDLKSTIRPIFRDVAPSSSSTLVPDVHSAPPNAATSMSTLSTAFSADTNGTSADRRPLLQPIVTDIPAKTITLNIAGADGSGAFHRDAAGVYTKTLTLQWPATKSNSHWAIGETMQTGLVSVRFFVQIKVIISSPFNGTETVDLEERELFFISTNESERKVALAKYSENCARSKSKSPRRSKREQLPSPPDSPTDPVPTVPAAPQSTTTTSEYHTRSQNRSPTRASLSSASSTATLRRPHTSAGPRDKSNNRALHRHPHEQDRDRDRHRDRERERERITKETLSFLRGRNRPGTASLSPSQPDPATRAQAGGPASDPGTVRAWEEELERIELQSRRSSADMLGFKRKRPGTATMRLSGSSASSSSASLEVSS